MVQAAAAIAHRHADKALQARRRLEGLEVVAVGDIDAAAPSVPRHVDDVAVGIDQRDGIDLRGR